MLTIELCSLPPSPLRVYNAQWRVPGGFGRFRHLSICIQAYRKPLILP